MRSLRSRLTFTHALVAFVGVMIVAVLVTTVLRLAFDRLTDRRIQRLGAVPIARELGYNVAVYSPIGLVGPRGMAPATVSRLMPFSAANGLLGTRSATDTDATLAVALSNPGNAALFAAYALSAVAIGWWMTTRKDA